MIIFVLVYICFKGILIEFCVWIGLNFIVLDFIGNLIILEKKLSKIIFILKKVFSKII